MHENAVGYALMALDAAERAEFEAHLDSCELCQQEVAEFCETAADLSFLTQAAPPPTVRANVLAAIRILPQLPAEDEKPAQLSPRTSTESPTHTAGPRADIPDSWLSHERSSRALDQLELRRQRRRNKVLKGLVAALLIVAVGLGGVIYTVVQQRQAEVAAKPAFEEELLRAEDAQVVVAPTLQGGGRCTFIVSRKLNRALYLGTGMPDPGQGRQYQLWTVTGTLPNIDPNLDNPVPNVRPWRQFFRGDVAQADFLAVSIEEAGSTPDVPTSDQIVVLAPLAS
jgi:hypothetical protein